MGVSLACLRGSRWWAVDNPVTLPPFNSERTARLRSTNSPSSTHTATGPFNDDEVQEVRSAG